MGNVKNGDAKMISKSSIYKKSKPIWRLGIK